MTSSSPSPSVSDATSVDDPAQSGFPRPFGRHYLLLKPLGAGGMGNVFMALTGSRGTRRVCAVKTLAAPSLDAHTSQQDLERRFADEARLSTQLSSENLVYVFDGGVQDGERYLAMELIRGRSLAEVQARALQLGRKLAPATAITIVIEILSALSYLHKVRNLGLVHRDLSPENVMLTYTGAVKLIDFGVAKWRGRSSHTEAGIQWGRLSYKAPEQHLGQTVDARADLFSAGVILWEMLTGQRLFPDDKLRPLKPDIPAPSQVNPMLPAALDAVVLRALVLERDFRYPTADEFRAALSPHQIVGDRKGRLSAELRLMFGKDIETQAAEELRLVGEADALPEAAELTAVDSDQKQAQAQAHAKEQAGDWFEESSVASAVEPPPQRVPSQQPAPTRSGLRGRQDLVGAVLMNRYEVTRLVGRGAMGTVYEALHKGIGKRVAVKVPNVADGGPELIERLKIEAGAAGQIDHPNVAMVTDSGTTPDGHFFYVMEFVEGIDLAAVIHRDAPLALERALDIGIQICRGVEAAHAKNVVHRDLKPSNVLLLRRDDEGDHVKILDFGLAKLMEPDRKPGAAARAPLTRPEAALGTPRYMAPEQIESGGEVDERADVYAMCVMLYEMLTRRTPHDLFPGGERTPDPDDPVALCRRKLDQPPTLIANHRAGLPAVLEKVIMSGLHLDPFKRPRSAADFRRTLVDCLRIAGREGPEMRPSATNTQTVGSRRRPRVLVLGGLGLAAAVVALIAYVKTPTDVEKPVAATTAAATDPDRGRAVPVVPAAMKPEALAPPPEIAAPRTTGDQRPAITAQAVKEPVIKKAPATTSSAAAAPVARPPAAVIIPAEVPPVTPQAQDPEMLLGTAELAYQRGDLLAAARDARGALAAGAGLKGHLVLAKILLTMERKPEARAEYQRALAIDPTNVAARRGLELAGQP